MKHSCLFINSKVIVAIILLIVSYNSYSQNDLIYSINSSGNEISGNNGFVSYSIGQVFYSNFENTSHQINEGIQQSEQEILSEENPTITCPNDINQNIDAGVDGAVVTFVNPVGTDNATGAVTTQIAGPTSGSVFPIGTTTITFQVEDTSGNIATCSFDVIITDDENESNPEDIDDPEDDLTTQINVIVFPNPTTDNVTLVSNGFYFNNNLNSYQLYNYQGKLIRSSLINQTNTIIDLSDLSTSIYLLQVFNQKKLFKTIKIIKK